MRITPHQAIAGFAVLVALILVIPRFGGFDIRTDDFLQEPRVVLDQAVRSSVTADVVIKPVSGDHVELIDINSPFEIPPKKSALINGSSVPPPPPFELPDPPPMPLPEK